jgi:hypothetical protein
VIRARHDALASHVIINMLRGNGSKMPPKERLLVARVVLAADEGKPVASPLDRLERYGKATGWLLQIVIAIAAVFIAILTFQLNRSVKGLNVDSLGEQDRKYAIEAVSKLATDSQLPSHSGAWGCMTLVNRLDDAAFAAWIRAPSDASPLLPLLPKAGGCALNSVVALVQSPNDMHLQTLFSGDVYGRIVNHINSYQTFLSMLAYDAGDPGILCKAIPEITDSDPVSKFVRRSGLVDASYQDGWGAVASFANKGEVFKKCHR